MNEYKPSELAEQIIKYMDCPCEVFPPMENDAPIHEAYAKALEEGHKSGFTPVIITVDETLWECLCINAGEENEDEPDIQKIRDYRTNILSKSADSGKEYLLTQLEERKNDCDENEIDWDEEIMGEMKGGIKIDSFSSFWSFGSDETCETILAKIPAVNPWEIFAWLPMGGWNDCPDTKEMIAVSKYWYESYGAVPAAISHDELEFYIEKPVKDKAEAQKLALEQYAFCPDRVEQCEEDGSIGKLADSLTKSDVWYFWWD